MRGSIHLKLKLAYENELELPSFNKYEERVNFINDNIFNNEQSMFNKSDKQVKNKDLTFEKFYNIRSLNRRTDQEEEQVRERWLGVKRVGSPFKDESVKLLMDFLSGYLLFCKDYSARHEIHRFKELKKRHTSNYESRQLDSEELKELQAIEENIVYYKFYPNSSDEDDVVLYHNKEFESFLQKRIKEEPDKKVKKILIDKLKNCEEIRSVASFKKMDLAFHSVEKITLKDEIQQEYQELKQDRKNKEIVDSILNKVKKIRNIDKMLHSMEVEISNLVDDYFQLTELHINQQ